MWGTSMNCRLSQSWQGSNGSRHPAGSVRLPANTKWRVNVHRFHFDLSKLAAVEPGLAWTLIPERYNLFANRLAHADEPDFKGAYAKGFFLHLADHHDDLLVAFVCGTVILNW